jgi:cytoskeletal protein RodZ
VKDETGPVVNPHRSRSPLPAAELVDHFAEGPDDDGVDLEPASSFLDSADSKATTVELDPVEIGPRRPAPAPAPVKQPPAPPVHISRSPPSERHHHRRKTGTAVSLIASVVILGLIGVLAYLLWSQSEHRSRPSPAVATPAQERIVLPPPPAPPAPPPAKVKTTPPDKPQGSAPKLIPPEPSPSAPPKVPTPTAPEPTHTTPANEALNRAL